MLKDMSYCMGPLVAMVKLIFNTVSCSCSLNFDSG